MWLKRKHKHSLECQGHMINMTVNQTYLLLEIHSSYEIYFYVQYFNQWDVITLIALSLSLCLTSKHSEGGIKLLTFCSNNYTSYKS